MNYKPAITRSIPAIRTSIATSPPPIIPNIIKIIPVTNSLSPNLPNEINIVIAPTAIKIIAAIIAFARFPPNDNDVNKLTILERISPNSIRTPSATHKIPPIKASILPHFAMLAFLPL